jgi:hypothetical protein
MDAQTGHTEHHVVGPVHVIELHDDDAESIASALEGEREHGAARVIIDITGFDGSLSIVLEGAEKSGWDHDIMIRTADQRHLTLEELRDEPSPSTS